MLLPALCALSVACHPAPAQPPSKPPAATPTPRARPAGPGQTPAARPAPRNKDSADALVRQRVDEILTRLEGDGDCPGARSDLQALADQITFHAAPKDLPLLLHPQYGLRLLMLLSQADPAKRAELLRFLRACESFGPTLAFLLRPGDDMPRMASLIERLRVQHESNLNAHAALAAAVCVVHDIQMVNRLNENTMKGVDGVPIYDYFIRNERFLAFERALPAELMLFVVDASANIEELEWARAKYAGQFNVGDRYAEVKYDSAAYKRGDEKKVTKAGISLRNILQHGGVCIDQAYFAATVGKSLGVPTAIVYGRNATDAHAWMGYLRPDGRQVRWDLDTGHYDGYKGARGSVMNPQTRGSVPDSYLGLLADAANASDEDRWIAAAICDAAQRLSRMKPGARVPPVPDFLSSPGRPRAADKDAVLEVLETGLRRWPASIDGWLLLRELAEKGELTLKDKVRWGSVLDSLCGKKWPDFMFDILRPMIETEPIADAQPVWNTLATTLKSHPQLYSELRLAQGQQWEREGNSARAWECYQDVVTRYPNESPVLVDAVERCVALLRDGKKESQVLPLYAGLWPKLKEPKSAPGFRKGSNWYRVGEKYAAELSQAGDAAKSAWVLKKLGGDPPPN
jgi:hypothetical protein